MRAAGILPVVPAPPKSRAPPWRVARDQEVLPMHRPASLKRALGRAAATPTSNPATGTRSLRGPTWLAGLALAAALIVPCSASAAAAPDQSRAFAASFTGSLDHLADLLAQRDPGARVGGNTVIGVGDGQPLIGVHGRPNFIVALG